MVAVLHTVEFQKRGLPHAHILVWQEKDDDRVVTPPLINSFISATGSELTDVDADAPATAPAKTMESALAEPPKLKRATATAAKTVSSKKLKELLIHALG